MNCKKQIILVAFIVALFTVFGFQGSPDHKILFEKAKFTMETKGDLNGAINLFTDIIKKYPKEREYAAKSQLYIGLCYEKLGVKEAQKAYQKVVNSYPEQTEAVKLANEKLSSLLRAEASNRKPDKLPATGTELTTRRVLEDASGMGGFTSGLMSSDGKFIRNVDWKTGDVIQYDVAGGQINRITNSVPWTKTETALGDFSLSRDGKQIAYDVEASDTNTKDWLYQIKIRNIDGSGLRTIYSDKDHFAYPIDWSPNAEFILADRQDDNTDSELIFISTADGSIRAVKTLKKFYRAFISPDGKFIAFSNDDIALMTAEGQNEVVVAGHPAKDRLIGWTPDGRRILFLSDRSGTFDMWAVRVTGGKQLGEPELLKKDFGTDTWGVCGFASDGSLYYKTQIQLGGLYNGTIDIETGKVLVPPIQVSTRYTGPPTQPVWSPDGKNLLYISSWGFVGRKNILLTIRSAETGEERLLPSIGFVNHISWAPDGRSVVALWNENGESGTVRIDAQTGMVSRLADLGLYPKLSPDGKTLFYADGPILWKRNLETGEKSEVVNVGTGGTAQWGYDLSPDGREVVSQKDSIISIVSLNGGASREIFRGKARSYSMRWTQDGSYIIVRSGSAIWRIPSRGGAPLKLDLSVPKMASFALHPDNSRFVFTSNEGIKSELWVLENFLPK